MRAHGSYAKYVQDRCRCDQCRHAAYRYSKLRRLRRADGDLLVPAVGARRRIQALQAIGWTTLEISRRMGRTPAYGSLIPDGQPTVRAEFRDRVCAVYDELSMTPGPSVYARNHAARQGWVVPLKWDEWSIDDPDATPVGGRPEGFCAQGHRLSGDNLRLYVRPCGTVVRRCVTCRRAQSRAHYARQVSA